MQIRLQDVKKTYRVYHTPKDRFLETIWPFRTRHVEKVSLNTLSLDIDRGETVGIIGMNGSGKSTLLKVICGIITPASGTVSVQGRIGALLELGAGFNPEMSGRQNAILQFHLMGYPPEIIPEKVAHAIEFSEIGDFIEQPVRTYSSGMFLRLAFAIHMISEPDILVIDEALAVGDAYFQTKCTTAIRSMIARGRTLLLVSHDPGAIKTLCKRAIFLQNGNLMDDGHPDPVFDYYQAMLAEKTAAAGIGETTLQDRRQLGQRSGNLKVEITRVSLTNDQGQTLESFGSGQPVNLQLEARCHQPVTDPTFGFLIRDRLGNDVFGTNNHLMDQPTGAFAPGEVLHISYRFHLNLGPGIYMVTVASHSDEHHLDDNFDWINKALTFQVHLGSSKKFVGVARLDPAFSCHK